MKGYFVFIITCIVLHIVVTIPAPAVEDPVTVKACNTTCTQDLSPVCGYDSICYKRYPNKCAYDYDKCNRKNNLETVDTSLCDLADRNNHPDYKTCAE